jgi:hypothetical protein
MDDDRAQELETQYKIQQIHKEYLDKNKLDQGKYQAGVIQDFIPALSLCIAFGRSTNHWDNIVYSFLEDYDVFQLKGMYTPIGKSGFLNLHAMAFCLLCYLEEHRREVLSEGTIDVGVSRPFLLMSFKLALKELAELGSMNNKPFGKYDRGSWKLVENAKERYLDAFWRHQLDDLSVIDPTTGKLHVVAMLWNLLALITFNMEESNDKVLRAMD